VKATAAKCSGDILEGLSVLAFQVHVQHKRLAVD
jgi:hypothetical protein